MSDEIPPIDVICEDGAVLAVNKPSGAIVQGAPRGVVCLADQVRTYLKAKYNKPGNVYLGIPHRLDRPVSGVVVFSRNSKCAARLSEQFAKRVVTKTYLALLEQPPPSESGQLEDYIYRIPDVSKVVIDPDEGRGAKYASLNYRILAQHGRKTLVEIDLGTGRMHQIRIQFASRGCPVLGDEKYGATQQWPDAHGIALHAWKLELKHPVRYDDMSITAPLPAIWKSFGFAVPS